MKLKRGQKYVVRAHKDVDASQVGLGSGEYEKGNYVSPDGFPVKNIKDAHVYKALSNDNDFPWEDEWEWGTLSMYFLPVPVKPATKKGKKTKK